MQIDVNGRFLTQSITGVQRYAIEVVAAIDRLIAAADPGAAGVRMTLHVPAGTDPGALPLNATAVARHGPWEGHAWEQLVLLGRLSGAVLFCPGNTAPIAALLGSRPVVVTVHDLSFRYFPDAYDWRFRTWYRVLIPLIMCHARRVITVSESERAAIVSLYPSVEGRLAVVQNGGSFTVGAVPLGATHCLADLPARFLLYVGSLSRRKNFRGVVAAFLRVAAEDPSIGLVVAGAAADALRAAEVTVPDTYRARVVFLGQVNDAGTLAELYRRATCFVFPSFYEASPLPPIEAMSLGCPVVASSIPSLRERCGDAAEYCDPGDAGSIAEALRRVLSSEALVEALRLRGQQRAAMFTWEQSARRTLDVLRAAARQSSRRDSIPDSVQQREAGPSRAGRSAV